MGRRATREWPVGHPADSKPLGKWPWVKSNAYGFLTHVASRSQRIAGKEPPECTVEALFAEVLRVLIRGGGPPPDRQAYGIDFCGYRGGEILVMVDLCSREAILRCLPNRGQKGVVKTILSSIVFSIRRSFARAFFCFPRQPARFRFGFFKGSFFFVAQLRLR